VRHNLRVKHGDIITVHPCPDIKYVSSSLGSVLRSSC
jgi:transitional endoplasmic reticulum ATPase